MVQQCILYGDGLDFGDGQDRLLLIWIQPFTGADQGIGRAVRLEMGYNVSCGSGDECRFSCYELRAGTQTGEALSDRPE